MTQISFKHTCFKILLRVGILILGLTINIQCSNKMENIDPQDLSKIWIHRVNHPKKLELLVKQNKNVETDVILTPNNTILVGHDVNDSDNIPFTSYLDVVKGNKDVKFWLDTKNVVPSNQEIFVDTLTNIIHRYQLKQEQFLIESTNLEIAKYFSKRGYLSSFYIWIPDIKNKNEDKKEAILTDLKPRIKASKVTRLSFDYSLMPTVKRVFKTELPNVKYLSWNTSKEYDTDLNYAVGQVKDTLVDIFLIKYKTDYDR